jgi:RND family efflux transporter MFP subunit
MKRTILIMLAMGSVVAVGLYLHFRGGEGIAVKVITVEKGEMTSTLSATGKVVSREEAEISASTPALVKAVLVEEGERVEEGALLALLDDRELGEKTKGAEESLREANAKVRRMERTYQALSSIYAVGGTSRQSVDDTGSDLEMARAAASRASAELNVSRLALDRLRVRAPFAGIVTRRSINPGEWASPGVAIFSLSKEDLREIEIAVDESDAGLVKVGQNVDLTTDAFPGYVWVEEVTEVAPAVRKEGAANSIKVRASYGSEAPDLKLGQQVDAKIRTAHRTDAVKLPFNSVMNMGGRTFVAMVKEDAIRFIPIVTGIENAVSVEIVKGISPGDEVVSPQGKPLKEGERVKTVVREPTPQ